MSSSWNEDDPDVLGQTTIKTPPSLTTNYRTSSRFGLISSNNQPFAPENSIRDFRATGLGSTTLNPPKKKNPIIPGCTFTGNIPNISNSASVLLSKTLRESHTDDLEALQHKTASTTIKKKQRSNSEDENPSFVSPQNQQQRFSQNQLSNVLKEQTQRRAHSLVPPRSQMQQKDSLVNLPSSSFPRGNMSRGNYKYHDDAPSLIDDESLINDKAIRAEISHITRPITTVNRQILQNSDPHNAQRITYAESSTFSRLTRSQAPRLPPVRKQPETVDLLSDDEDGGHQHDQTNNNVGDTSLACLSSSSSRKTILPERFPLLAIHFGLLEVVTSTQSLCTLSLMGSSHNMAWRFSWYVEDKSMITDLEKDDLIGFREYIDEGIVYVALEMRASTRFSNVPVGRNYIIFPDATVNEVEKYIILTMTTETHLKWRNELAEHYPFVLRGEKIDRQGRIKLWENHKRRESMSYDVCRERIEKELGEIKFKQERADRRRAAASSSYLEDPNDSVTFVVYPIEPEVPDAVTISRGDMKRLEPGVYFNDNLIDLKIKHLLAQLNEIAPEKRKRIHAFSCLFYAKLTEVSKPEEAHTLVAKWTKNVDLFAMDYILFPINSANHWSLMVLARPDLLINWEEDFEKIKAYDAEHSEREIPVSTEEANKETKGETEINQEGDENRWKPPLNRPAFLHLDSLNMHSTAKIQQVLARYMYFEREKRYRPAQLLRQQENMKTNEKREKSSDENSTEPNENVRSNLPLSKENSNENVSEKTSNLRETTDKSENVENTTVQNDESNDFSDGLKDTPSDEAESTPNCENSDSKKLRLNRSAKKSRKSLSEEENAAQEAALAVKAAMDKFVRSIAWVKCVVPKQQNGYDCGVFVIRFAEMIIQKRPQTTSEDIRDKMRQQFAAEFTQEDIVVERMKLKSFLEGIAPAWKELRDAWIQKMKEEGKEVTDTPVAPIAPSLIESKEEDSEESVENEVQQENADDGLQANDGPTENADGEIHEGRDNEDNDDLNIPSSRNRYKLSQDLGKPVLPSLYAHMIASHSPLSQVDKTSEVDVQKPAHEQNNKIGEDNDQETQQFREQIEHNHSQQLLRPRRKSMADAMKPDYHDHSNNTNNNISSNKRKSLTTASFESAAFSFRHNQDDSIVSSSHTAESMFDNVIAPLKSHLSADEVVSVSPKRARHDSPQEKVHAAAQVDSSPSKSSSSSSFISTVFRSFVQTLTGGNNTPNIPSHTKRKRSEYESNAGDLDTSLKVTVLPPENEDGDMPTDISKSKRSKKKHHHSHSHRRSHQDEEKKEPTEVTIITSLKHLDDVTNEESEENVLDLFEEEGK